MEPAVEHETIVSLEELADALGGEEVICDLEVPPEFLRKIMIALHLLEPCRTEDVQANGSPSQAVPVLGRISAITHRLRRAARAFRLLRSAVMYDIHVLPPEEERAKLTGSSHFLEE